MAIEKVKVVNIDTKPAQTSVKELRQELKSLKDQLLSTEQGTEEYNKTMSRAAEIQHTLKEQMEEVNARAMDFGQIAGNVTKTVGGLVAGFQAAKATMSLFGIENETVLKSLKKMQDLMAITQALPALDNGIKAFKRLRLAIQGATASMDTFKASLVTTGIGALVVALGLLIANWDKVTDVMKRWGIISEDTDKKLAEQKKKVEDLNGEIAKLQGTYADWEKKNKISKLNSDAKKSYEELGNAIEGLNIKLEESVAKREKENAEQKTGWKERWKTYNDEGLAILEQIRLLKVKQGAILENADSYKEISKGADKAKEKMVELFAVTQDFLNKNAPNVSLYDQIVSGLIEKYGGLEINIPVKIVEDEEEVDTTKEDAFRKKIEDTVQSLRQAFMTPEEQYAQEIGALEVALNTKLIKEEEYLKLRDALNKEQAQREIQRYATAAGAIGSIFSSLGDLMEEGSEEQKALQIMGATINMLGGITAAISGAFTTHSGPWDIALAALQAAAIAASGAATIAQMTRTNKSNAGTSSISAQTSAINSVIAPVQYTQDVQGAAIEGAITDSRVYVTETDITNTQNRVRVTEREATF